MAVRGRAALTAAAVSATLLLAGCGAGGGHPRSGAPGAGQHPAATHRAPSDGLSTAEQKAKARFDRQHSGGTSAVVSTRFLAGLPRAQGRPLSRAAARARFTAINRAYADGARRLVDVTRRSAADVATIRAAVRDAAAAYDRYLAALAGTAWPKAAQPSVTAYLAVGATVGRAEFAKAKRATSMDQVRRTPDPDAALRLADAETRMSDALTS